ncbi:MAG: hypothetical protein KL787_02965 [Taibaiella sp.]|nr:hypothetical protein [Taibaiella sp.]
MISMRLTGCVFWIRLKTIFGRCGKRTGITTGTIHPWEAGDSLDVILPANENLYVVVGTDSAGL